MKTIIKLIPLLVFIVSCTKLDEKPRQSLVVPGTLQDFQGLLDNTDVFSANYASLTEIMANDFYITPERYNAVSNVQPKRAYIWEHDIFSGVSIDLDWNSQYQKAFYCNVVLDGLEKLEVPINQSDYNNIKGQALAHRASAFLSLVQEFTKPYNANTAGSDLGIPLRLSADLNIPSKRATLSETYQQMIDDLLSAKALLPITPLYKTRPSKPAVLGLLARLYLSQGDYKNALSSADSCLQLYSKLIDYNTLSITQTFPFPRFNDEVIFDISYPGSIMLYNRSLIYAEQYALYGSNDLRKSLYFINNADNTKSFKGQYTGGQLPFFCGIATDEMYLIRSECLARLGRKDEALTDLNTLLTKRFKTGTFQPVTANSADEALLMIITERRKQLLRRGVRWSDLRRLNQEPRFAVTLTRTLSGTVYTLPPNDPRYTLPIPDYVIALSGIQQNP